MLVYGGGVQSRDDGLRGHISDHGNADGDGNDVLMTTVAMMSGRRTKTIPETRWGSDHAASHGSDY